MLNILALSLLSAAAITNFANIKETKHFVQLNLGASHSNSTKYKSTINNIGKYSYDSSLGIAPIFGIEIGTRLTGNFRSSLSLDYRSYSNDITCGGALYGQEANLSTESFVAMVNGYYDFSKGRGFNPYIVIGLGLANNSQEANGKNGSASFLPNDTNNFAYKIGLGAKYQINKSFDIDFRYQFVDLGKVSLGSYNNNSTASTNTSLKSGHLRANELLLGISYKF